MKNIKNLSRRALSLFLALVMCLSLVNLTAFADTTGEDPSNVTVEDSKPAEDGKPTEPCEDGKPTEGSESSEPTTSGESSEDSEPAASTETIGPAEDGKPAEDVIPEEDKTANAPQKVAKKFPGGTQQQNTGVDEDNYVYVYLTMGQTQCKIQSRHLNGDKGNWYTWEKVDLGDELDSAFGKDPGEYRNDMIETYLEKVSQTTFTILRGDKVISTVGKEAFNWTLHTSNGATDFWDKLKPHTFWHLDGELKAFTVSYVDGQGSTLKSESNLIYGEATPVAPTAPERKGYTFTGWDKEVADTVTGDATYTAQWQEVTTPEYVYVYVKSRAPVEGWTPNADSNPGKDIYWYTIGSIQVNGLESATSHKEVPVNDGYESAVWNTEFLDKAIKLAEGKELTPYMGNESPNSINGLTIDWKTNPLGLHTSRGAVDFGKEGNQWHLDGMIVTPPVPEEPNISVTKTTDQATAYTAGQDVTWTITVKNNGTETVEGLSVVDTLNNGTATVTAKDGAWNPTNFNLEAGATATFTATLSHAAEGSYCNTATVKKGDDTLGSDYALAIVNPATAPDITITKTANKDNVPVGGDVTFTITVENTGTAAADVEITDTLPDGLESKGTTSLKGTVAAGGTLTLNVTATVTKTGEIKNVAAVKLPDGTVKTAEKNITGTETGEIKIEKTRMAINGDKSLTIAKKGDVITWEVKVTNESNVKQTIALAEQLSGATLAYSSKLVAILNGNELGTKGTVTLNANDSVTLTATYTVTGNETLVDGKLFNTVKGTPEGKDPVEGKDNGTVIDDGKGIEVEKTYDGPEVVKVGATVTWSIKVTNLSNVEKTVNLTEKLAGATLSKDSVTLAAGAFDTVTATYVVKAGDAGKVLTNTVVGKTTDNDPEKNSTANGPTVDNGSGIEIKKVRTAISSGKDHAVKGDTITWTITVTNKSNVEKTVTLEEKLDGAKLDKNSVTLAAGKSETVTATYTVTGSEKLEGNKLFNTVVGTTDGKPTEGKDDGTDIYVQYTVVHEYYTDGTLTGSTSSVAAGKVGDVITADSISKVTSYNGSSYTYTSASGAPLTLVQGENGTITLRYDRSTGTPWTPPSGGDTTYKVTYEWSGLPEGADAKVPGNKWYSSNVSVKVNDTYTDASEITVDGVLYTFSGWTTEDVTVDAGSFKMPSKTVTLVGVWTENIDEPDTPLVKPNTYKLTVHYVYADGTTALEDYVKDALLAGDIYSVASPAIDGYTVDTALVAGQMPDRDVEITVVYTTADVELPDGQPPLVAWPIDPMWPVDVPDEQPPLTDIPEEQPPLTDIPDEELPLTDIPEENVPMVGVPQTGDYAPAWVITAVLSALGLVLLGLKKREGEEG